MPISRFFNKTTSPASNYYTGPVSLPKDGKIEVGSSWDPNPGDIGGPVYRDWKAPWLQSKPRIDVGELVKHHPGILVNPGPSYEKSDLIPNHPRLISKEKFSVDPHILTRPLDYNRESGLGKLLKRLFAPGPSRPEMWA